MKRIKNILGVTLLEVLLVLAIAAMIIVMSIRYYKSATESNQANQAMSLILAIAGAADNLAIATGTYPTASSLSTMMGAGALVTVNGKITYAPGTGATYTITMPLGAAVCASVLSKTASNKKLTLVSCASGNLTYTYDNTQ